MISRAHGASSPGAVGRQLNTLRRLGVSEMPVVAIRSDDAQVLEVRERGDAKRDANLRVGQRVIDRREQIDDRAFEPLNERGGHRRGPARK